jgi:hypothetical protein
MMYLIVGMIAGALYWLNTVNPISPSLSALYPVYIHLLVVGWLTQLIYGVIYWMFPIISKTDMRGNARLAWTAWIALNLGMILRAVCEPWRAITANPVNGVGLVASAVLQVVAAYLVVMVCWPRVRERAGK